MRRHPPDNPSWIVRSLVDSLLRSCGVLTPAECHIVVSLLTEVENKELGLEQEAAKSTAQGLQFLAFPIVDRAVPASLWATRSLVEAARSVRVRFLDHLVVGPNEWKPVVG